MTPISRRQFLQQSSLAIATSATLFASSRAEEKTSVNEELRVAVIGVRGRGRDHISGFTAAPGTKVVAFCDCDKNVLDAAADKYDKSQKTKLKRYEDYRKLLEDKEIDIVAIASPNHWHALMTIDACEAGKDVYCEKPVCHNVWEGRQMIETMQKTKRIVGAGFQNRSDVGLMKAFPWIQAGNLGKITAVRGLCNRNRKSIGKTDKPLQPPAGLNYDLWLGPAQDIPMYRPQFHYDWHWVWNTGNGDMGNQGPHEMDLIQWILGDLGHPRSIRSVGGRFAWHDGGNTPNMQVATFDFGNGIPVVFEVRNIHNKKNIGQFKGGPGVGVVVTCEGGEFQGGRGGGSAYDKDGKQIKKFPGDAGKGHMDNFIEAVRKGDAKILRSPLVSAFHSSCMSHLANISVRTGSPIESGEVAARANDDSVMREVLSRFAGQLGDLKLDFAKTPWLIGDSLTFDGKAERFTAGETREAANALLKREYRKEYVVKATN